MEWTKLAINSQLALTLYFAATHWISMAPWNDLTKEVFPGEKRTNLIMHGIQIFSIVGFFIHVKWIMWIGTVFWTVWMFGHLMSWWFPYFLGMPKAFLEGDQSSKTLIILPRIKNHPIPDLCHMVLGVLSTITIITVWVTVLDSATH